MNKKKKNKFISYILKPFQFLWSIRSLFIWALILFVLVILFYQAFIKKPLFTDIMPLDKTIWYLNVEIEQPVYEYKSLYDFLSHLTDFLKNDGIYLSNDAQRYIDLIGVSSTTDGYVLGIYPSNTYDFWDTLRKENFLPEFFEKNFIYGKEDIFYMWHKGYFLVSSNTMILEDIKNGSQKIRKNIFEDYSLDYGYRQNKIVGYLRSDYVSDNIKDTFNKENQEIYNSMIDPSEGEYVEFDGYYDMNNVELDISVNHKFPYKDVILRTPLWVTDFSDGIMQGEGVNFSSELKSLLNSDMSAIKYFNTYVNYIFSNTGVDLVTEIEKFLNRPYVFRIFDKDENNINNAAVFLIGDMDVEDILYLKNAFIRYMPGAKPVKKYITLQDGTRASEWIIDVKGEIFENEVIIDSHKCHRTSFEKDYKLEFIYCMNEDMTVLSTSMSSMKSMLSDVHFGRSGIVFADNETVIRIPEAMLEEYRSTLGDGLTNLISKFELLKVRPLSEDRWRLNIK